MITRNISLQLKIRTHVVQEALVSCNPCVEKFPTASNECRLNKRAGGRKSASNHHSLGPLDEQKSRPVSKSVPLELICGERPKRRYEPTNLPDPRPTSRASAGSWVHRSRRVWLPPPSTRCGRRPPLSQAILLPSNLQPEISWAAEYAARGASGPRRAAVKTSRPSPSRP